uniref:Eukaryotic translation initiation factor 5 n=1 Tax=Salmo salar TaxID=8030 RepID=B9EPU2_SALSA|nr:Eukaryotic translation initiation factor 5 [Salmo salar]
MSVNVNRSVLDQFYRYKMPRIIAKVEGKGNGIKTVIVNMTDVAKSLNRPPTYPTKFFGCELGAQTQFDAKNDRFIVNGSHEASKLQDMLDGFIRKFVLCPECDNPETDLHINAKKQTIGNSCKACGYRGMLDTRHKLCTFILRNPPEDTGSVKKKEKKSKKRTTLTSTPSRNKTSLHRPVLEHQFCMPPPPLPSSFTRSIYLLCACFIKIARWSDVSIWVESILWFILEH